MPLAFDSSLLVRPDPGLRAHDAERLPQPSESERAEFASELQRAARAEPAGPSLVPAARTRLTGDQAAQALSKAWTQVRGEPPSEDTLAILVGQWAHETGRGQSMLNYNFGGIKGSSAGGLSTSAATREGWGESEVRTTARFRAYGSAEEGAKDYVSLLVRRYPEAVGAAEAGDPQGFVHALKARGYFTDNEASYARSVSSLAAEAKLEGFDALGAGTPVAGDAELSQALALAEAGAPAAPSLAADLPLGGGALLEDPGTLARAPLAGMPVSAGAFADEVNRAALLMSALRIAEPGEKRS